MPACRGLERSLNNPDREANRPTHEMRKAIRVSKVLSDRQWKWGTKWDVSDDGQSARKLSNEYCSVQLNYSVVTTVRYFSRILFLSSSSPLSTHNLEATKGNFSFLGSRIIQRSSNVKENIKNYFTCYGLIGPPPLPQKNCGTSVCGRGRGVAFFFLIIRKLFRLAKRESNEKFSLPENQYSSYL